MTPSYLESVKPAPRVMMVKVAEMNSRNTAVLWALDILRRNAPAQATDPPLTYRCGVISVWRKIEHIRSYVATFRHRLGLAPKVWSGVVEISGKRQAQRIVFVIEDDGAGIPPDAEVSDGFAVSNVRDQIDLHCGEAFGVKLTRRPEGGTRVRVKLPFNPSESETGGREA